MNLRRILKNPSPSTGWMLDGTVAAAARKNGKGELYHAVESLPEGCFEVGPVGLQNVHLERLVPVLRSVQGRVEGAARAAVVVPTSWVRIHVLDFEELPRRSAELEQVIQWRLKKVLPIPPSELRISSVPQPPLDGRRPLLCLMVMERALAEVETAFAEAGVEPGLITPRLFALASTLDVDPVLLIQHENEFLSLMLIVAGRHRMVRTKPLPATGDLMRAIRRELNLAEQFIRQTLSVEGPIAVAVNTDDEVTATVIGEWVEGDAGLVAARPPEVAPALVSGLGAARAAVVNAVTIEGNG